MHAPEETDVRRASAKRNVDDDKDRIVEYLKKTKGEVPVNVLAKDLNMKRNRPAFVASHFPNTLVTFDINHTKKHVYYIDLHHQLRRFHM
jgi:hypothetical protein